MSTTPTNPAFSLLQEEVLHDRSMTRQAITAAHYRDEPAAIRDLLRQGGSDSCQREAIRGMARGLVGKVREQRTRASGVDALMHEFSLSSDEGIALMCLAEALLRIPDAKTADRLIADKISRGDWRKHLGLSPSLFVNAATWGLLITGKLVSTNSEEGLGTALSRLLLKGGEPLIRKGVDLAMRVLGKQFVTGQTITEALHNSRANTARGYRYSYDMLGEAALTDGDARRYYAAYEEAIKAIGEAARGRGVIDGPGISVKLSALHPRYSRAQRPRVLAELLPRLKSLLLLAKHYDIGLNIDAEEADRLELSLDLIDALAFDPALANYAGLGIVIQAYQKRCPFVIDHVLDLARRSGRRFMVRLVKGAYWDAEIKRAQVAGLDDYPVFTRKLHTDVSYLVCASKLLDATAFVYPQFATHNAQTLATIETWARERRVRDFEFQCLHGMGEPLYDQVVGAQNFDRACRIYAPVGSHETLLAYLVRRLLENGANSSFVHQIVDESVTIDSLVADPFEQIKTTAGTAHPHIPLPVDLFGPTRKNSTGIDFSNESALSQLAGDLVRFDTTQWHATPLIDGSVCASQAAPVINPALHEDVVGTVIASHADDVETALAAAEKGGSEWQALAPSVRAAILCRGADAIEGHRSELMALAVREAGKTLVDALAEIREAVDFLRYYATQADGTTVGQALGTVACISPWNFPLAIFIGEVSAALAAGNAVLAKPAEQTPLIAWRAVTLLHAAGVPRNALQFLPGTGEQVGAALVADPRIRAVIFTGSTAVARHINRTLAQRTVRELTDIPLIAETGGQNAMIVDSSALTEQVVQDVLQSAFGSAGQRCSALRILCLQDDIATKTLTMLREAMQELNVGKPSSLACDIGPVIDATAQTHLHAHVERLRAKGLPVYQCPMPATAASGSFVAPTLIEIDAFSDVPDEVFGPVLHVLRFRRDGLEALLDAINATGYGLTLGIHTRIDETIDFITERARVGNIYVNRNMIGAVVGSQPFGGEGLSGTGPKAGGPLYLKRLQKQPLMTLGAHTISNPSNPNPQHALLDALLGWAHRHDQSLIVTLGERYLHESLLSIHLPLPGPTGETNTLSFAPRGLALCASTSLPVLLNQLAAAYATGNDVIMLHHPAFEMPDDFPVCIRDSLRQIDQAGIADLDFDVAMIDLLALPVLPGLVAQKMGAVVPIIDTHSGVPIALWRLLSERVICVNTTAAGGNASLMTMTA